MSRKLYLTLSNLYLDLQNPRYEVQKSQNDALNTIASEQKGKLLVLLKDILVNGLNPSDIPIVMPDPARGRGYVVLEGNRRIAALKLFKKPDILTNSSLRQKYSKLHNEYKGTTLKNIECLIVNSREEASLWIERKHEGEMNGAGTVRWDNVQKSRFLANKTGKDSRVLQLIDFMNAASCGDKEFEESLQKVSATNLERFMGTPDVRSTLGLEYNHGEYSSRLEWSEILKGLKAVVNRLSLDDFNVRAIYRKEDRMRFLNAIPVDELPDKSKKSEVIWKLKDFSPESLSTITQRIGKQDEEKKADDSSAKSYGPSKPERPTSRTMFLPEELTLSIPSERVNRIYSELKQMSHLITPNACAVMLRVFLELSMDYYLENFGLLKDGVLSGSRNGDLKSKINLVIKNLSDKKYLDDSKAKGIRDEINARQGAYSVDTLNAYVHNLDFNPIPNNLMLAWDNIQPFVLALWKAANND
jgi:hypothetical protein